MCEDLDDQNDQQEPRELLEKKRTVAKRAAAVESARGALEKHLERIRNRRRARVAKIMRVALSEGVEIDIIAPVYALIQEARDFLREKGIADDHHPQIRMLTRATPRENGRLEIHVDMIL